MARTLQRPNLNLPAEARARLRARARAAERRESEYARELLLRALEEDERAELCRAIDDSMTEELRDRLVAIAGAMETLAAGGGRARSAKATVRSKT